jgi:hypothetical protein
MFLHKGFFEFKAPHHDRKLELSCLSIQYAGNGFVLRPDGFQRAFGGE